VEVPPEPNEVLVSENIKLDILYEDKDLIVLNKPSGMVVHPGEGNKTHTLVNALLNHTRDLSSVNTPERPGIVHRLDKETSGVMVVAKNNRSHLALAKQFEKHSIKRVYVALVEGNMEFEEGDIDLPLSRSHKDRKKIAVSFIDGKNAKTYYRVIKRYKNMTLLELEPHTGRTHQLRVHLAHLGHPILGDEKYGKKSTFPRLALHAKTLGFIHPTTKEFLEFSKDLPADFNIN
jgi:23S rRNA pseudouridine1911/1915/1917 synthase